MSCFLLISLLGTAPAAPPPIETVTIDANRAFQVNGQPFFPIMIWLQDPGNFPKAREAGINTIAGYWPKSGGTEDVSEYLELVASDGFYGVMPYHAGLHAHPALLGYIHDDEPDLTRLESDAEIVPAEHLRLNSRTPLWRIVDGATTTWSVLDPLQGAAVTIELPEPVTVERLGVWLTISEGLAVARDVTFLADERELIRVSLEAERGRQEIPLPEPATFGELTLRVDTTHPGEQVWGSVGEIEGFDAEGNNLLLSPPRTVPRQTPEHTLEVYEAIRRADASRPVFMTLTANFLPFFEKWSEEQRERLYPGYVQAADVLGFDVYPIYGWGRPEWLHLVHDGTARLRELAGERPVYAWIETSKGSQWVSESRQMAVTPEHIRAEVWMALCRGATAIGYFTHIWKPSYSQFGVPPENVAAMRQVNEQITRLAPALLADPSDRTVRMEIEGDLKADVMAKELDGVLHLFAVNHDPSAQGGEGIISVSDLAAGRTVEVVEEERTLTSADGQFQDHFDPLAVHIYRIQ